MLFFFTSVYFFVFSQSFENMYITSAQETEIQLTLKITKGNSYKSSKDLKELCKDSGWIPIAT